MYKIFMNKKNTLPWKIVWNITQNKKTIYERLKAYSTFIHEKTLEKQKKFKRTSEHIEKKLNLKYNKPCQPPWFQYTLRN